MPAPRSVGAPLAATAETAGHPDGPPRPLGAGGGPNPRMEQGIPAEMPILQGSASSDYMVDVIESLGISQIAANPGTSFLRGLHGPSLINYSRTSNGSTCTHEEASVAIAHGYAKIEGKPMMVLAHGTVGLQHASMAVYNAWCDRVPIYMMVGNTIDAPKRGQRRGLGACAVQDAAALVRDFRQVGRHADVARAFRGFRGARLQDRHHAADGADHPAVLDSEMQDRAAAPLTTRRSPASPGCRAWRPVSGDQNALAEAAQMLVSAENPVIVADRNTRTQAGIDRLVELAETLHVPICDMGSRMNFPTRHKYNLSERARALIAQADVILGLELLDYYNATHSFHDNIESWSNSTIKDNAKLIASIQPRRICSATRTTRTSCATRRSTCRSRRTRRPPCPT